MAQDPAEKGLQLSAHWAKSNHLNNTAICVGPNTSASGSVNHHLVFRDDGSHFYQELGRLFPDVALELHHAAVVLVLDEHAVCPEGLLECPQDLLKVDLENLARRWQAHLFREASNSGPGLSAGSLLHSDVDLVALGLVPTFQPVHGD